MQCPRLLDCIHDAQKCPSQFHLCSSKCHETLAGLKIQPSPSQKLLIVEGLILVIMVPQHFLKFAFIWPQLVETPPWFLYGWHKTLWHLDDQWNKPMPPQKVDTGIIFSFYLSTNKLNVWRHPIKVVNPHFAIFAMSTLPTWTIQSRHNGGRWWHPNDPLSKVFGLSLPSTPSPPMKAIMFYFWQKFWTNPSTISPFHVANKFRGGIFFQWVNYWHPLDQIESNIP